MSAVAMRRLGKELAEIIKDPPPLCTAGLKSDDDLFLWSATITGPPDTPYAGGVFNLTLTFSPSYPFSPPLVNFDTKIYHPNIAVDTGYVCVDILKYEWSPLLSVSTVLLSICALLQEPCGEDPLMPGIGELLLNNPSGFKEIAASWTKRHAMG